MPETLPGDPFEAAPVVDIPWVWPVKWLSLDEAKALWPAKEPAPYLDLRPTTEQIQEMAELDALDQQRRHFQEKWELDQSRLAAQKWFDEKSRDRKGDSP